MEHTMKIMRPLHGDEEVKWDPEDEASVSKAKEQFDKLVGKGYKAYKMVEETVKKRGEAIKDFDPAAGSILLAPPMAGG